PGALSAPLATSSFLLIPPSPSEPYTLSLHDALPILHFYSRFGVPPTVTLVSLLDNRTLRTLVDNAALKAKVAGLKLGSTQFRKVDRKSTRLNSSHQIISYAVFCLKKKTKYINSQRVI